MNRSYEWVQFMAADHFPTLLQFIQILNDWSSGLKLIRLRIYVLLTILSITYWCHLAISVCQFIQGNIKIKYANEKKTRFISDQYLTILSECSKPDNQMQFRFNIMQLTTYLITTVIWLMKLKIILFSKIEIIKINENTIDKTLTERFSWIHWW